MTDRVSPNSMAVIADERDESVARFNTLQDEFLSIVSHELRAPLNAILGWAQMIRAGGMDVEQIDKALEIIERSGVAQVKLIDDLLDMSRITSGTVRIETKRVDLLSVVSETVSESMPAAAKKGLRIVRQFEDVDAIAGDPARMRQIVSNLMSNAMKFTPRGGFIKVSLRQVDREAEITVADNGIGIAAECLPRIFDRFRQVEPVATRHHKGLGLGLPIVKHLTELHGGKVTAQSDGLGSGASFTVLLPITEVHLAEIEDAFGPPGSIASRLQGLEVLAVDDEIVTLDLMQALLTAAGAKVTTAGDGPHAIDTAMSMDRLDLIICDISMPGLSGYDVIRQVRQQGVDAPAVALTAFARVEDRQKALDAGFDRHVAKPVRPTDLLDVIERLLSQ